MYQINVIASKHTSLQRIKSVLLQASTVVCNVSNQSDYKQAQQFSAYEISVWVVSTKHSSLQRVKSMWLQTRSAVSNLSSQCD